MREDDLELFAINSGELYNTHCELARHNANRLRWLEHVVRKVIPLYIDQVEPRPFPPKEIDDTAKGLQAYYDRHISEF